jgi:DNA-binding transcriptional LysR family regulator
MFNFTNRQIEIFLSVCKTGSYRRTADLLGLSEAGVSHHIRTLESQVCLKLFERRRGAANAPSAEGERFRCDALRFVDLGLQLGNMTPPIEKGITNLRLYVGRLLLENYVRPKLSRFIDENPDINISFAPDMPYREIRAELKSRRLMAALVAVRNQRYLPKAVVLATEKCGIYVNERLAHEAKQHGLGALPFLLTDPAIVEESAQTSMLKSIGVREPRFSAVFQFHDVGVAMAIRGQGALASFDEIVSRYDRNKKLIMIKRMRDSRRCLYLHPDLNSKVAKRLKDFFASCLIREK